MIILISGARHTGKTMLAKRLSERYQIPYKNFEYIQQNMLLNQSSNTFLNQKSFLNQESLTSSVENDAHAYEERLWFTVETLLRNALEKEESMVLEGNFLPPQKIRVLDDEGIISMHLLFTPEYIEKNYDCILSHRQEKINIHEGENIPKESMLMENNDLKNRCADEVVSYFMFQENHESEMDLVCELIDCMLP